MQIEYCTYINLLNDFCRTDAGVHALRNVVQVDINIASGSKTNELEPAELQLDRPAQKQMSPKAVQSGLNYYLQSRKSLVYVTDVTVMHQHFDARREAKSRTYMYKIICPKYARSNFVDRPSNLQLFQNNGAWMIDTPLDVGAMKTASLHLLGEQDFSSFRNSTCQSRSPFRNIFSIDIESSSIGIANNLKSDITNIPSLAATTTSEPVSVINTQCDDTPVVSSKHHRLFSMLVSSENDQDNLYL